MTTAMIINGLKIVLTWFDRLTMTGHPELVEGCKDYFETFINSLQDSRIT